MLSVELGELELESGVGRGERVGLTANTRLHALSLWHGNAVIANTL